MSLTGQTESQVDITWNTATGAASYGVYVNGVRSHDTVFNYESIAGLTPSTLYDFSVSSKSFTGAETAQSTALSVKTSPAPTNIEVDGVLNDRIALSWAAST